MRSDKHSQPKLLFQENSSTSFDDDPEWPAAGQSRLRIMIGRAVLVYSILFMVCGILMSALGLSPLTNNGIMPKTLLVFVGLSFVIALYNNSLTLSSDYGFSMSGLAQNIVQVVLRRSKRGD